MIERMGEWSVITMVALTLGMCLYGCVRDVSRPQQKPIFVEQLNLASKIVCE
jgi:hypothetical protein